MPLSRIAGDLSNTTWSVWAEVYFRTKWRLHPSSRLATIDIGQKLGGVGVPFFLGVAGSPSNTKSPVSKNGGLCPLFGEVGAGSSSNMQLFDRSRHGPKIGGFSLFGDGGWVPIEHKVPWAEAYIHTKWHLDAFSRLATIEMGRKLGTRAPPPFWGEGAGSQSNTKSPGLRPTSMSSAILVHPAVWPQNMGRKFGGSLFG